MAITHKNLEDILRGIDHGIAQLEREQTDLCPSEEREKALTMLHRSRSIVDSEIRFRRQRNFDRTVADIADRQRRR